MRRMPRLRWLPRVRRRWLRDRDRWLRDRHRNRRLHRLRRLRGMRRLRPVLPVLGSVPLVLNGTGQTIFDQGETPRRLLPAF
jgi:hypothetical protein